MKYDWNDLLDQLDKTSDFRMFLNDIEGTVLETLDINLFEQLNREIRFKTHYMTDDQQIIWSIAKYLQVMLTIDFKEFSKEISLPYLEKQLILKKAEEESLIKNDIKKTTQEKDILLENLENKYNTNLTSLRYSHKNDFNEWMNQHNTEFQEYMLIKIRIEEWFKAAFKICVGS